jgi:tetratricopeptide (TPR) repeat protein
VWLQERISWAADVFHRIIATYGESSPAYVGLGKCELRLGNYAGAVRAFEHARALAPSNLAVRAGLAEANHLLSVARAISTQLPAHQHVLQLRRLPCHRQAPFWAALSAVPLREVNGYEYRAPCLSLFRQAGSRLRRVWQSGVLRDPRFDDADFLELELELFDYTGDGVPEAAVWEMHTGGSWEPYHLVIFQRRGSRLNKILGLGTDGDFRIGDFAHDGRCEVANQYRIGEEMCHAAEPYWHDLYAYDPRKRRYTLANRRFPKEFRAPARELWQVLHEYPKDGEIRAYLGLTHEILGLPRAALADYRTALAASQAGGYSSQNISELRARIKVLRARVRRSRHHGTRSV